MTLDQEAEALLFMAARWHEELETKGSPRQGGGEGISRQTVVPSTDASKENTCEATFAFMWCQCVSCNTNQASGVRFGIIRHGINVGPIPHFR